jgi:hypothetical protein
MSPVFVMKGGRPTSRCDDLYADIAVPDSHIFSADVLAAIPASEKKQEAYNQEDAARKKGGERAPRKRGIALSYMVDWGDVARSAGQEGAGLAQGDEGDATDHDAEKDEFSHAEPTMPSRRHIPVVYRTVGRATRT